MSEIRPEKDYLELSAICQDEMRYSMKSVVEDTTPFYPKRADKGIPRLHANGDACKESIDISKEAMQGCSATVNPVISSAKPSPMATDEEGKQRTSGADENRGRKNLYDSGRVSILRDSELGAAIKLFKKGLRSEVPKGSMTNNEITELLDRCKTLVYRHNGTLAGLVSFEVKKTGLYMEFICVEKMRKGIGSTLMKEMADYAIKRNIKTVYSEVSSLDTKACGFYTAMKFKEYGKRKGFLRKIKSASIDIKQAACSRHTKPIN